MSCAVVLLLLTLLLLLLVVMVVEVLLLHGRLPTEGGLLSVVRAPALLPLVGSAAPGEACCAAGSTCSRSNAEYTAIQNSTLSDWTTKGLCQL